MSVELRVPQLGESITEAVVGKWNKQVGDAVAVDEAVVVLETDKVTIDVQAPTAGAIERIAFAEGAKVRIGDVLGSISEGGRATAAALPVSPAQLTKPAPAQPVPAAAPQGARAPGPGPTPVARAVASDKGLDAAAISGSGVSGRVMKDDVLRAATPKEQPAASAPPAPVQAAPVPPPQATQGPAPARPAGSRSEERVKMTPLRKRVAERLLAAQSTAAILTTFNEVDMSAVMRLRKEYGERFEKKHGVKLGFMSFFVRAAIEALKAFPAVNASIEGEEVVFHRYYDLGVAVSGARGLVVPVVRDADLRSMAELEKAVADLGTRARTDKLKLDELQGGTFTISNGGVFGSMLSTPILNPPQSAILGMHNIVDRAVVRDGQIVARPVMYLALSYDHRLIDGREAVQFLVKVRDFVESPERMLLEV